jgi:aminopeptidase N
MGSPLSVRRISGAAVMRTVLSSLAIVLLTSPGSAQRVPVDLNQVGDGAAKCAEGKAQRAERLLAAPRSLASANIDITYYHLDLDIDLVASNIDGVVRVEGTVIGSPMTVLVLDLASNMVVSSAQLPDATPLAFSQAGDALDITLPGSVSPGGAVEVDVAYSGTPNSGDFGYFVFGTRSGSGRYAWSLSEPYGARQWWPCKDHPSDKADSVRVTVTVPSQYRVGSQGTLVGETVGGGNTTYDWVSDYPISSYLVSVSVAEYVRYQAAYLRPAPLEALYGPLLLPLEDLVYDDTNNSRPAGWAQVWDMIEVFEDWFGPYPFASEKYGHAEVTFGGGMEHQTMSSMGGSSLGLVAHELAHQWFGDKISPRTWPELWLNEGFATFGELVYWEERSSTYPGTYESVLAGRYNSAKNAVGTLVLEDTTSVSNMFAGSRVYSKGAVVLNMLRHVVGDAVFKDILRVYAADPAVAYGVASTADFKRVAETESGLDLSVFFDQWVTSGTGYPSYQLSSLWYPSAGGYTVWARVAQTQELPQSNVSVFEMPLVIAVLTTMGEERFVVQNDQRTQNFELAVSSEPVLVVLDPDEVILRSSTVETAVANERPPAPIAIRSLSPNPARALVTVAFSTPAGADVVMEVFATGSTWSGWIPRRSPRACTSCASPLPWDPRPGSSPSSASSVPR